MLKNPFKKEIPSPTEDGGTEYLSAATEALHTWHARIDAAHHDDAALIRIAHQAPAIELKLAALDALQTEDALKQAMREFREQDKRLYRSVRSRWQALDAKRSALAEAHALISNARGLLEQDSVSANRVVELDRGWSALQHNLLEPGLAAEFNAIRDQLVVKVRAHGEGEQAVNRWLSSADDAIARLTASLAGVAAGEVASTMAADHASALLELLSQRPDALDTRCITKAEDINRTLALASSVVQRAEILQSLPTADGIDDAGEKDLIERWRAIPEVAETRLQSVLAQRFADWRNAAGEARQRGEDAQRALEQDQNAERRKKRLEVVQAELTAAEEAHAAGHVGKLNEHLASIERALKSGPVNAELSRRIDALRQEQKRLRDWQRWSGRQGREQLVAEAQSLAADAAGKIVIKTHGEAIDGLRERWKELDKLGAATNQALWLTFDGALKAAYTPIAAHLEKLKAARSENLAARERIISGLAQVASGIPAASGAAGATESSSTPDWKAIARALEDARTAWRKLGPVEHTVPRKAQKGEGAVTARYEQSVAALEQPLNAVYAQAIAQREKLVAEARALSADASNRDTPDKVRGLQARWQTHAKSLALPRRDENRLWEEFKTATDAIFTARDAARNARESEFNAKTKERTDIVERLSGIITSGAAPDIKRALTEADAAWRAAAQVPKPLLAKLDARFRAARDAAARRVRELASNAAQARYDALGAAISLSEQREVALDTGQLTPEQTGEFEQRWNGIADFPGNWRTALEARFRAEGSVAASPSPAVLPDTLLNLEVALGMDSPAQFQAARQQLKLRALKAAMEGRQASATTPADIERWLLAAAATARPDAQSRERLAKIIAAAKSRR